MVSYSSEYDAKDEKMNNLLYGDKCEDINYENINKSNKHIENEKEVEIEAIIKSIIDNNLVNDKYKESFIKMAKNKEISIRELTEDEIANMLIY